MNPKSKFLPALTFALFLLATSLGFAQTEPVLVPPQDTPEETARETFRKQLREQLPLLIPPQPDVSGAEKAINFGAVYIAQWGFYLVSQREEIDKIGSWDNWRKYPLRVGYDKDSFNYNLIKHSFVGQYYYLWYRSRGYSPQSAFLWSYASSFAFEFTIETVTEPPSQQDIYQTPVFGTVLGVGAENLSSYFHRSDEWYGPALGYLFNPFTLLPSTKDLFGLAYYYDDRVHVAVTWNF